jgi:microcystin-dependent protein
MADATTPRFGFTLPTVGLDRDAWGDLLNANWSKADATLATINDALTGTAHYLDAVVASIVAYVEPVGSIKPWPTPTTPPGWMPCDGWEIDRTQYTDLFAVIGTYYGAGNGTTTFNIPNWFGMVPVHRGDWMPGVNSKLGEKSHTLAYSEMPPHAHAGTTDINPAEHTHGYNQPTLQAGSWFPYGANFQVGGAHSNTDPAGYHQHTFNTDWRGDGQPHNNIQPSVGVLWIIKATHVGF